MNKSIVDLNFDLNFDLTKPPKIKSAPIKEERQDLANITYSISDLAKLEERLSLGQALKKVRNEDARGGTEYEVILINKTCLVVRREYVKASKLTVIIPEQAIYHIYNEINGQLLSKNDPDEFKKFFQRTPEAVYRHIEQSELLWKILTIKFKYVNGYYTEYYGLADSNYENTILTSRLSHNAPYLAIISKTKQALTSKDTMDDYIQLLKRSYRDDERDIHIRVGIKALKSGIPYNDVISILRYGITDINVMRNLYKQRKDINQYLKNELGEGRYERIVGWRSSNLITLEALAGFKKYNIDIRAWADWALYILNVEEVNIFGQTNHYFDVLDQQIKMNNGKIREKYPKMWLSYEHKIQQIYRRYEKFIKEQKQFIYPEKVEKLEHKPAVENNLYQHIMILPRTYGDIIEEGEAMKHCVASYGDRIYNHETIVMFLRKKTRPLKSFVTVEFKEYNDGNRYEITQVKGLSNSHPDIDAIIHLEDYVKLNAYKHVEIKDRYVKQQIENGTTNLRREELRRLAEERRRERGGVNEANPAPATAN